MNLIKQFGAVLKKTLARDHLREAAFDRRYGIDTSGYVDLESLDGINPIKKHGHDYHGTPIRVLKELIRKIPGDISTMAFVDYGSGLGRTLFAAVELGFASIVGVEYCEDFYRRSLRNITAAKLPEDAKKNIQVLCVDAAQYLPPETDCVLYFFNPFDEELLSSVMAKILISYAHRPRNMYIIYYNPWYRKVIDRMIGFDIIAEGDLGRKSILYRYYEYIIYQVTGNSAIPRRQS